MHEFVTTVDGAAEGGGESLPLNKGKRNRKTTESKDCAVPPHILRHIYEQSRKGTPLESIQKDLAENLLGTESDEGYATDPRAGPSCAINASRAPDDVKDFAVVDPRSALMGAIKSRNAHDDHEGEDKAAADPRAALMGAIKSRKGPDEEEDKAVADPRAALLGAIRSRKGHDEGEDNALLSSINSRPDEEEDGVDLDRPDKSHCGTNAESTGTVPTKDEVAADAVLSKYAQMCKRGVPVESTIHAMSLYDVSQAKIDQFKRAYGVRVECSSSKRDAPPSDKCSSTTGTPLQKVHWNALNESRRASGSLWDSDNVGYDLDGSEVTALEAVFSARTPARGATNTSSVSAKKVKKHPVTLLDIKRANLVGIGLKKLLQNCSSHEELCRAVDSLDSSRLDIMQLQVMLDLIPTVDEIAIVLRHKGGAEDLGDAEKFFLAISNVPRFEKKLKAFAFMLDFDRQIRDLQPSIELLRSVCSAVVESLPLYSLLRKLLAYGNAMNESNGETKANGIEINSLLNTAKKRGLGETTLADMVLEAAMKQGDPDNISQVESSLPRIKDAARIDVEDLQKIYQELRGGVQQIKDLLEIIKKAPSNSNDNGSSSAFVCKSKTFIKRAEAELNGVDVNLSGAEFAVHRLCKHFAEDPKTCRASSILEVVIALVAVVSESVAKLRNKKAGQRQQLVSSFKRQPTAASLRPAPKGFQSRKQYNCLYQRHRRENLKREANGEATVSWKLKRASTESEPSMVGDMGSPVSAGSKRTATPGVMSRKKLKICRDLLAEQDQVDAKTAAREQKRTERRATDSKWLMEQVVGGEISDDEDERSAAPSP